ncbi:hypothetical protein TrCOL_g6587 [Triparma columacea]|uniref:CW-type domain-containing protein n=1 Tax=Triparma columacea TaxID=722753 RepID=A0A9W7FXX0_9STRA|nr:hypothetical protein TrCOL_g6587 [Triparma columacea]
METAEENWIGCDLCNKWRIIPEDCVALNDQGKKLTGDEDWHCELGVGMMCRGYSEMVTRANWLCPDLEGAPLRVVEVDPEWQNAQRLKEGLPAMDHNVASIAPPQSVTLPPPSAPSYTSLPPPSAPSYTQGQGTFTLPPPTYNESAQAGVKEADNDDPLGLDKMDDAGPLLELANSAVVAKAPDATTSTNDTNLQTTETSVENSGSKSKEDGNGMVLQTNQQPPPVVAPPPAVAPPPPAFEEVKPQLSIRMKVQHTATGELAKDDSDFEVSGDDEEDEEGYEAFEGAMKDSKRKGSGLVNDLWDDDLTSGDYLDDDDEEVKRAKKKKKVNKGGPKNVINISKKDIQESQEKEGSKQDKGRNALFKKLGGWN